MELLRLTPETPRPSLRQTLQAATHRSHSRLDAMFAPMLDQHDGSLYARFIAMNHACHEAIEPVLTQSPLPGILQQGTLASRLPALRLDRAELRLQPVVMPAFHPQRPDLPQSIGISYVLEGSRLGGAFLHRQLQKSAGGASFSVQLPHHYLAASAEAGGFRRLMDTASRLVWEERSLASAAEAAAKTFDYFLLAALRTGQHA